MKILAVMIVALAACGCANAPPNYAGSPGSVYDQASEAPHKYPASSYDPEAPLKPYAPQGQTP